jgi:hypothetical protein
VFVNHLCEAKGEQNGQADKAQESFCQLVIASGDAPIAFDSFEEVFYPVTTPVERCREWHSRSAVAASRNAGFYSFSGRCLPEGRAIIGFVANEGRILCAGTAKDFGTEFTGGQNSILFRSVGRRREKSPREAVERKLIYPGTSIMHPFISVCLRRRCSTMLSV